MEPEARACAGCGLALSPAALACPACQRLVHGERLKALAEAARNADSAQDPSAALAAWRSALELLPEGSTQHTEIGKRIAALRLTLEAGGPPAPTPASSDKTAAAKKKGGVIAGLGAVGVLLLKLKIPILFMLGKGKLLLLGLTKMSTLLSMLLAFGVYWVAWGWQFALGLLLSIYVHEMGHVAMSRRYGIAASAPLFIPGVGAFVRLKQQVSDRVEDARIGLAGPIWGTGASLFTLGLHLATGSPMLAAIARVNAWINLFNLLPLFTLDGGRAFHALGRGGRWAVAASMGAAWLYSKDGILALLALGAAFRAFGTPAGESSDRRTLLEMIGLVVVLTLLLGIPVALPGSN